MNAMEVIERKPPPLDINLLDEIDETLSGIARRYKTLELIFWKQQKHVRFAKLNPGNRRIQKDLLPQTALFLLDVGKQCPVPVQNVLRQVITKIQKKIEQS